ncbi:hypothetical protein [Alkalibaculum bacchi]|nr:hypothetical protein [Alkalibaculum bacchi]
MKINYGLHRKFMLILISDLLRISKLLKLVVISTEEIRQMNALYSFESFAFAWLIVSRKTVEFGGIKYDICK